MISGERTKRAAAGVGMPLKYPGMGLLSSVKYTSLEMPKAVYNTAMIPIGRRVVETSERQDYCRGR